MPDIRFPHLGINIEHLGKSVSIGNFSIAFYGIIIAFGMVAGYFMATWQAKRLKQNTEIIIDLAIWDIIFAIVGARLYYVIFKWDYYSQNPLEIFNLRAGGLAIYGGVIAGVITTAVFAKVRKISFWQLADIACGGLLVGQIFGRWGNFFNREAFGGYTDSLLAMQIKRSDVRGGDISADVLDHLINIKGISYIQVHPTFLYECLWNIGVLIIILLVTKHRKYEGQLFAIYLMGYGLGRFWIEGLRTDQLILFQTGIPVSQLLSAVLFVGATAGILWNEWKRRKLSGNTVKKESDSQTKE